MPTPSLIENQYLKMGTWWATICVLGTCAIFMWRLSANEIKEDLATSYRFETIEKDLSSMRSTLIDVSAGVQILRERTFRDNPDYIGRHQLRLFFEDVAQKNNLMDVPDINDSRYDFPK